MARRWCTAALAALALPWLIECNAFRDTKECAKALDCPRGSVCAAEGGFCRTGGAVPIGFLAATSGTQAPISEERRIGLEFGRWIVEREPSLKVLGRGITFRVEDTLASVTEVPAATTRLLEENVVALIGPAPSAEVLEAQKQTYARQVLQLAPNAGAPSLKTIQPEDPSRRFLFQMVVGVEGFVPTVPLFLAHPERPANYDVCFDGMAIVTSDDILGAAIKTELEKTLGKNCVPVTVSMTVPATKRESYSTEIDALVSAEEGGRPTRCVFLGLPTDIAGELLRALKDRERRSARAPYSAFLGSGTLNAARFYEDARSQTAGEPSFAEGFYGIDADGSPNRAELRDLETLWDQYVATEGVVPPGESLGFNRGPYTEAVIVIELAIELAGTVEDPVAVRDALIEITRHDDGDRIFGPKDVADALRLIRSARKDGRRAAIDYRGSYSNLDFQPGGFVRTGTIVWRAKDGKVEPVPGLGFREEDVAEAAAADPGPACAARPAR